MVMVGAERSVLDDDAGAVPVVGHPVGLELEHDIRHDRGAEQPVEVGRVQPLDDVGHANRTSPLEAREQIDDADRGERIASLGDGRWGDRRIRQAVGSRTQRWETDGGDGGVDHGVGHLRLVQWGLAESLPPEARRHHSQCGLRTCERTFTARMTRSQP